MDKNTNYNPLFEPPERKDYYDVDEIQKDAGNKDTIVNYNHQSKKIRHGNMFLLFFCLSTILLIVCVFLLFTVRHWSTECRNSRSDGYPETYCYNHNLYCEAFDPETYVSEQTVSWTGIHETISFPVGGGTEQVGICYGNCFGLTGCTSMGACYGYCTGPRINTIYLQGLEHKTQDERSTGISDILATLIDKEFDGLNEINSNAVEEVFRSYTGDDNKFIYANNENDSEKGICSSIENSGIFQSIQPFRRNKANPYYNLPYEYLKNTNKAINLQNGFDPKTTLPVSLLGATAQSVSWSCVDPGFIYPCNGRVQHGTSYCYPDGTSCVPFCNHGHNDADFASLGPSLGLTNVQLPKGGFYQTNGMGSQIESSNYRGIVGYYDSKPYTVGSIDGQYSNTTDGNQNINQFSQPGNASAATKNTGYIQDLVFCGGTSLTIDTNNNNYSNPLASSYPNFNSKKRIGF